MVKFLHSFYIRIIDSFREKCTDLIAAFKQKHFEHFSDFAELFTSRKFNIIYENYADSFIYSDFKEDSLQIAKSIMLNDHFVGGLYLLYSLHYMQDDPKQPIRLEHDEFKKIQELVREERLSLLGTCQPGFVFAKLLLSGAFAFPYFSRNYSMEEYTRTRLIYSNCPNVSQSAQPIDREEWLNQFLEDINLTNDLRRVDEEYFKKKRKLKQEHRELNLALDLLREDTIGGLREAILEEQQQPVFNPEIDIGTKRRVIKNMALKRKRNESAVRIKREKIAEENRVKSQTKKKTGCPRGRRRLYFNTIVNVSEQQKSESSGDSDLEHLVLDLPNID